METKISAKNILQFIGLTYLIAWASEGIMFIGNIFGILKYGTVSGMLCVAVAGIAPAISIFILLKKWNCIKSFKDFWRFIFKNDSAIKTITVLAVFYTIFFLCGSLFGTSMGNPVYLFVVYIPVMIIGGGLEEIGWRGYLQPALEKYFPFPLAAVIIGIIWSAWHLPLWFIENSSQANENFLFFTLMCIWYSFIFITIRRITNCVFACVLCHAWTNTIGSMYYGIMGLDNIKMVIAYLVILIIVITITYCVPKIKNKEMLI